MKAIIENITLHQIRTGEGRKGPYTVIELRNYDTFERIELFGVQDFDLAAQEGDIVTVEVLGQSTEEKGLLVRRFVSCVKVNRHR